MRQTIDPHLEFNWGPSLWAAATLVLTVLVATVVLGWTGFPLAAAVVTGVVASARSDYYEPSGHNAVVGALLGTLVLSPILVYTRVAFLFGIEGVGDTLFISFAYGAAWLILVIMIVLPLAYIGALLGDFTRKKIGGPLGY